MVVQLIGLTRHLHPVPYLVAQQGLAHRRLLADKALEGVLPQGGDDLDGTISWPSISLNTVTLSKRPTVSSAPEAAEITFAVRIIRSR